MRQAFQQIYDQHFNLSADHHILLGLSGGVDSMVLFDLLHQLPHDLRPNLSLAHVNHQLRPEADQDYEELQAYVGQLGFPLYLATWQLDQHPLTGIEAAGRDFRYQFFAELMEELGCDTLMTAHHKSDQAETVLMRLVRGGNWRGLQAIKDRQDFRSYQLIRPLLTFSKEDIYAYAKHKGIPYWEDATNAENDYSRNRYRNLILPLLKEENPAVEDHLADLALQVQDLSQTIHQLAAEKLADCRQPSGLKRSAYLSQDRSYRRPILQLFIKQELKGSGLGLGENLLDDLMVWIEKGHSNSYKPLGQSYYMVRCYDDLCIQTHPPQVMQPPLDSSFDLSLNQWTEVSAYEKIGYFDSLSRADLRGSDLWIAVDANHVQAPLVANHRQAGDRMALKGSGYHSKKIKDIFIDQKISPQDRERAWLVRDKYDNIIWLIAIKESRWSQAYQVDKKQYIIAYRNEKGYFHDHAR